MKSDVQVNVVRDGVKHLPLVYTAKEACEALIRMMTDMVKCDEEGERTYAQILAAVAHGDLIPLGFVDGYVVFGLPTSAPWDSERQAQS